MRKVRLVGAVAGLVLVSGCASTQWATHRAGIEVDALFDGLRATGAQVSYDPAVVNVGARAVAINSVVIVSPSDANTTLSVKKIDVDGIDANKARGGAQRIVLHDVSVSTTDPASPERNATWLKVPKVVVTGFEATPLKDADAKDPVKRIMAGLSAIKAQSIEMPSLEAMFVAPAMLSDSSDDDDDDDDKKAATEKSAAAKVSKPSEITKGRVILTGLDQGKLKQFRLEGFAGKTPNDQGVMEPFKLDALSIDGINVGGLAKIADALVQNLEPAAVMDDVVSETLGLAQGFEIAGLTINDPKTGKPIDIEHARMSWGAAVKGVPSTFETAFKMKMPLDQNDPMMATLSSTGIDTLSIAASAKTSYDATKKAFSLAPFAIEVGGLGQLSGALSLAGVPETAFGGNTGEVLAAMQVVELSDLSLSLKDMGAVSLLSKQYGDASALAIEALKQPSKGKTIPQANLASQSLGQFMASPGQTFTLKIKPRRKLNISQMLILATMGGPNGFFDTVDIATEVRR